MDPLSIALAVVAAIFAFTGPILPRLWNRLKRLYGRGCNSTSYLQGLGQQRVLRDVRSLLTSDMALRVAAHRHYIAHEPGSGGGDVEDGGWSSDFSDLEIK
ncbi:hypothetical protein B0T24DRAFT_610151 [Lasiosphaeria ovina]|uniref:Uncharacterized protein n=1 Tax=Lasiosphaeria ovina TaxID=92902 RepID=A0AAE0KLB1_9PEZI|nr:hypothetical protein B0T24DRAFT_610151 [Lasiosphaeria ovina]